MTMQIDQRFGAPLHERMTAMPDKQALYACDTYFHEGWEDIVEIAGSGAEDLVREHVLLVIKPEAIVGRRMHLVLDWLESQGFVPAAMVPFRFTPLLVRAMWFYQWNIASRERRDACDLMLSDAVSVLLLARRPRGVEVSASEHLAGLKGSFDPSCQREGDLRHTLRATSKQMTFVHSADEPADVARELAICLPHAQRTTLLRDLVQHRSRMAEARRLCEDLYADAKPHPLTLADAYRGLREAVEQGPADGRDELRAQLERMEAGQSKEWRAFLDACRRQGVSPAHWDAVVLANHLITFDVPGLRRLLPSARDGAQATR